MLIYQVIYDKNNIWLLMLVIYLGSYDDWWLMATKQFVWFQDKRTMWILKI